MARELLLQERDELAHFQGQIKNFANWARICLQQTRSFFPEIFHQFVTATDEASINSTAPWLLNAYAGGVAP